MVLLLVINMVMSQNLSSKVPEMIKKLIYLRTQVIVLMSYTQECSLKFKVHHQMEKLEFINLDTTKKIILELLMESILMDLTGILLDLPIMLRHARLTLTPFVLVPQWV